MSSTEPSGPAIAGPLNLAANVVKRLPTGTRIAVVGALALLLSLLLPWYGVRASGFASSIADRPGGLPTVSAFDTSTIVSVLLVACAVAALAAATFQATDRPLPGKLNTHQSVLALGAIAIFVVVVLSLDPPNFFGSTAVSALAALEGISVTPDAGMYIAVLASVAICAGGIMTSGGALAPASAGQDAGRLRAAILHAHQSGATIAVWSLPLAAAALVVALVGFLPQSPGLVVISALLAVATIVAARVARSRALAAGDADTVYLTRFSQAAGWVIIGIVAALILVSVLSIGHAAATL